MVPCGSEVGNPLWTALPMAELRTWHHLQGMMSSPSPKFTFCGHEGQASSPTMAKARLVRGGQAASGDLRGVYSVDFRSKRQKSCGLPASARGFLGARVHIGMGAVCRTPGQGCGWGSGEAGTRMEKHQDVGTGLCFSFLTRMPGQVRPGHAHKSEFPRKRMWFS